MTRCKACKEAFNPTDAWRKKAKNNRGISPREYCKDCYQELTTGEIPNVIDSKIVHGAGGLTYRQAVKKH